MNAVEIEAALSELAAQPFNAEEFPFAFLTAFGQRATTIDRLRKGDTNSSDVSAGVLQRNNIHIAVAPKGHVADTLAALKASPKTSQAKAKYILATDGDTLEAEYLPTGEPLATDYPKFPDHFGFFLPLAGITTVKEIKDNPVDVRATGRLNKLYVELLRENPDWSTAARRVDMNHFMARLIFCFFAEDTGIFVVGSFTATVEKMSAPDGSNTREVIETLFRSMNTRITEKDTAGLPHYARNFPYVNGGLFSGSTDVPRFTRTARSYLLAAGHLDWNAINPDIFGSMIQAVADDEERGSLGMHYTSVPNILKVLNPLFLDELRAQLEAAGDSKLKLGNLRKRLSRIRAFDPACGSGNFLVIAYKQLREIEAIIDERVGERGRESGIPLTNFRGIELRDFPAEIARLALTIAQFQCNVLYRGKQAALQYVLPLDSNNWITCGNALRLDWLALCPPSGTGVKLHGDDLFNTPLDQSQIDFENSGGETYICGNPPYLGKGKKEAVHLADMADLFEQRTDKYGYIDYVGCWFVRAADYCRSAHSFTAFVATNSVCQGRQLPQLWPLVLGQDLEIVFARRSFKWSNSAARNAGVTCAIVGFGTKGRRRNKCLFDEDTSQVVDKINPYLVRGENIYVESSPVPLSGNVSAMDTGSVPNDGGNLIVNLQQARELRTQYPVLNNVIRPFFGSDDFLNGGTRYCLRIPDEAATAVAEIPEIKTRLERVEGLRLDSPRRETRETLARVPHRFQHRGPVPVARAIVVPSVSSENREWFPVGVLGAGTVVSNLAFLLNDAPLWNMALIASRIHLVWIGTVCGKLETRYRYSNTLGWNTFPVPTLTEQNKADLTRCAEDILLAREVHFPATIADLYDPDNMPDNLRQAHERNDETLERIYIGRRFRNDTERLEKLFDMYTKMIAAAPRKPGKVRKSK